MPYYGKEPLFYYQNVEVSGKGTVELLAIKIDYYERFQVMAVSHIPYKGAKLLFGLFITRDGRDESTREREKQRDGDSGIGDIKDDNEEFDKKSLSAATSSEVPPQIPKKEKKMVLDEKEKDPLEDLVENEKLLKLYELCRAFETAGCKPPNDLKDMFERFKKEMAAEGKVVKLGRKGFEGPGYNYDEGEAAADANRKEMNRLPRERRFKALVASFSFPDIVEYENLTNDQFEETLQIFPKGKAKGLKRSAKSGIKQKQKETNQESKKLEKELEESQELDAAHQSSKATPLSTEKATMPDDEPKVTPEDEGGSEKIAEPNTSF
uniref:DEK_C domain-containing protein n=1 Tax=Caenorhabditis tropicalis TaxID=1561998 RepID=A0A1I7TTU1_9PELO